MSQLVGGLNPSEKYLSIGMIIPNIWENKKCSKPPTSQLLIDSTYGVANQSNTQHSSLKRYREHDR